ncbi:MAG: hypothetical protein ACRDGA_00335, partial [Bacteroidota bacterium]
MRVIDVKKYETEERHQRILLTVLVSLCLIGLSLVVYDYFRIVNRVAIPESLSAVDRVLQQWQAEGLVVSFDVALSTMVVNEQAWTRKRREEKVGIVTQLSRYCAEKNNSSTWTFRVVGDRT